MQLQHRENMAETPAWFFTKALSHRQKVLRLYKAALRNIDNAYMHEDLEIRYQKVILRSRFDAHKDEKDSRRAKLLLMEGIKELWMIRQDEPLIHMDSPPSFAYGRTPSERDTVLDIDWLHQERYQYPYYFEKRDNRKKEILDQWYKITGSWTKPFDKKNVRGD